VVEMGELKQCSKCGGPRTWVNQYWCKKCKYAANKKYYPDYRQQKFIINDRWKEEKQGVYGIFSDDKCLYVGESSRLNQRMSNHRWGINNPINSSLQSELYIRIAEYSNVDIKVLEETDNHKEREEYWINNLQPKYNSYV
jgi:hypothetical protein